MCDAELRSVSTNQHFTSHTYLNDSRLDYLFYFSLKSFFSNIMVVGGNSLLLGFVDRLNNEFNRSVRVISNSNYSKVVK